jgi:hypothetical protein
MDKHILVEIIAFDPETIYRCMYCETVWEEKAAAHSVRLEDLVASQPGVQGQAYQEISIWAANLLRDYGDRIILRVIDATSMEGVAKSIQYDINYYPAVIVNRQMQFPEHDLDLAGEAIDRLVEAMQEECVEC